MLTSFQVVVYRALQGSSVTRSKAGPAPFHLNKDSRQRLRGGGCYSNRLGPCSTSFMPLPNMSRIRRQQAEPVYILVPRVRRS